MATDRPSTKIFLGVVKVGGRKSTLGLFLAVSAGVPALVIQFSRRPPPRRLVGFLEKIQ